MKDKIKKLNKLQKYAQKMRDKRFYTYKKLKDLKSDLSYENEILIDMRESNEKN
jgi:inorganic pyrophosphatase